MANPYSSGASLFTHLDVSAGAAQEEETGEPSPAMIVSLLQELVAGQERQNELLEELVTHQAATQRQRNVELGRWKKANPRLAERCRVAAEELGHVQTEFLRHLTDEIEDSAEGLRDGEFLLNEFVDRYGPRLAHLNGVLQVLSQLSSVPNAHSDVNT